MQNPYKSDSLIADFPAWTFADFEHRTLQIAQKLRQDEVRSIALWIEDSAHLACVLLAAWHADVRVLFPPNLMAENIQWANESADLWISDKIIEQQHCFLFDEFASEIKLLNFIKNRPLFEFNNQTEIWLRTSGSTGEAKIIIKTAEQMWLGAQVLAEQLPFSRDNRITALSSVSLQHIYALTVHIMMSLILGWRLERKQQFFPEHIQAKSNKTEKTVLISSPAMLSRIDWLIKTFPNIIGIISSGGTLAPDLFDEIHQRLKCPVVEIYGSTETGPIAIRNNIGLWQAMPRSRLGCDENGVLWIEADWLSGRQQTADMVQIIQNEFVLLGRIDRIVKVGDKRISLVNVEQHLIKNSLVTDCYIGQYSEQEHLTAWVELNAEGIEVFRSQGRKKVVEQLKQYLAENQERSAIPRFWRFTDKLPRNSQSKISRSDFEKACVQVLKDPIWIESYFVEDTKVFKGKVPLDLVFFKGHFAQFPLVPGVIEVQWVIDKINEFFAEEKNILRIDNLKFQKFLRPNDELELMLKWNEEKSRMEFQLKTGNETCGKGLIIIG